jgi:ubiquinone/menaquinone biosynthesis C-methylase UbiE/uncharacterized protein YbaR (Trm112 family)
MRKELLNEIICPQCNISSLKLNIEKENGTEIRSGLIVCNSCSGKYSITNGIPDLLVETSEIIDNEQKGWDRLKHAVENTDELMLSLPDAQGKHGECWQGQADNFHYIFSKLNLSGNEKVLDLGAGRCWSTRFFSKKGCWSVGLDILLPKYIRLETSDIYIKNDNTYFERIRGSMDILPFKDSVFDIVFMAATLHHSSNISKPLTEAARVLKDNGRLILINETVKGLLKKSDDHNPEIEAGINENSYMLTKYIAGLKKAGFITNIQFWLGGNNRISVSIDLFLNKILPKRFVDKYFWKTLKSIQLFLFGGVLNLIAYKK